MLNEKQLEKVTKTINDRIDLPLLGEKKEAVLFAKALRRLDSQLETTLRQHCAPEIVAMMNLLLDESVSDDQKRGALGTLVHNLISDQVVDRMNERLDLPFLNEDQEKKLMTMVVSGIVSQVVDAAFEAMERKSA